LDRLPALAALELLPVPVLAAESPGAVLFANNAFAELLGYQKSSVLEMNLRQICWASLSTGPRRQPPPANDESDLRLLCPGPFTLVGLIGVMWVPLSCIRLPSRTICTFCLRLLAASLFR
jgi:PAS domain-containing protein